MGKKKNRRRNVGIAAAPPIYPTAIPPSPKENIISDVATQEERQLTPINLLFPMIKACRLCENKEGPFLNIFGKTEKILAKKIEELLPFVIKEDDELPHKICYRCSAKVEELHDFVQKCIKSQENLENELGKKDTYVPKPNSIKKKWEDKLNRTDKTNDDICDAVIQKAIERIRDINPKYVENKPKDVKDDAKTSKDDTKRAKIDPKKATESKDLHIPGKTLDSLMKVETTNKKENILPKNTGIEIKSTKVIEKELNVEQDADAFVRRTRSARSEAVVDYNEESLAAPVKEKNKETPKKIVEDKATKVIDEIKQTKRKQKEKKKNESINEEVKQSNSVLITTEFKVNSDTTSKPDFNIMDHISTIKVNGVGTLFQCKLCNRNFLNKDAVISHGCAKYGAPKDVAKIAAPGVEPVKVTQSSVKYITQQPSQSFDKKTAKVAESEANILPKSRPGPASKKIQLDNAGDTQKQVHHPNLKSYMNTSITKTDTAKKTVYSVLGKDNGGSLTIRRVMKDSEAPAEPKTNNSVSKKRGSEVLVIDDDDDNSEPLPKTASGPYPVGLFQTIPRNDTTPKSFTTPAMKKQSYTVLQTDNPSKLLISTRHRPTIAGPKSKKKANDEVHGESSKKVQQPFTVTLEDSDRQSDPNNGFFTFINVDPLLQPSYVLPTDNIIQESQITTSTSKQDTKSVNNNYPCNMCKEVFSREKKLLAHIQAHFNAIDKKQDRPKKRTRTT